MENEEPVPAISEEVVVPKGVKIKVKRSRKVEHTVLFEWTRTGEARLEAGYMGIVSGSIRAKIFQEEGRVATESETVEYEVELAGEKCSRYELKWIDIYRRGTVELQHKGASQMVPFKCKEKSQLEVMPGRA